MSLLMNEVGNSSQFAWIRYFNIFLGVLLAGAMTYNFVVSPKGAPQVVSYPFELTSQNYPSNLPKYRAKYMKHLGNLTYLDYTGAGVYPDSLIDKFSDVFSNVYIGKYAKENSSVPTHEQLINSARSELLNFLNASKEDYTVIFVASATQALKLLGESFPWTDESKYYYTRYNHNSILGIRKYALSKGANFEVIDSIQKVSDTVSKIPHNDGELRHLVAFPLEDNFAGTKMEKREMYKLTHSNQSNRDSYALLADASAFLPTNRLSLSEYPFDAVCLSFYKITGAPNSGALVVKRSLLEKLSKPYYASRSTGFTMSTLPVTSKGGIKLEDEAMPAESAYLAIHGLRNLQAIGMDLIQDHVWNLTRRLCGGLKEAGARVYGNHHTGSPEMQGGIVAFNLVRPDGNLFGYASVVEDGSKAGFQLRGGCHCNPGACFEATTLTEEAVKAYFDKKTTCGDKFDVVDGIPLGAVRASLGWASTEEDVDSFLAWVRENYIL